MRRKSDTRGPSRRNLRTLIAVEQLEGRLLLAALPILHPEHEIPDFVAAPTVTSIMTGNWNNPAIWSTRKIPSSADLVSIEAGHIVSLNRSGVDVKAIGVHGVLELSTSMRVKDFVVYADGTLNMSDGTEVVFADGAINTEDDPLQWGSGLIVLGSWHAKGQVKTPYVRSTAAISRDDMVISVDAVPVNWGVGDLLVLPGTEQNVVEDTTQTSELVSLASLNGTALSINEGAEFDHLGISKNPFEISRFPHVANLSRSVVLRSENPAGVRGHIVVTDNALVDIQNVGFVSLGRTTAEQKATDGGANQKGRYSFHAHHVHRPISLTGSVIQDGLKWGISLHDTNDSLIENNIVFDVDGAGIVGEEGDEVNNHFLGNLIIGVRGGFQNPLEGGREEGADGSGFWFMASGNNLRNNSVYDAAGFGFNYNGYGRRRNGEAGPVRAPGVFSGNEVVASAGGIWANWSQHFGSIKLFTRQVFEDTLIWHVSNRGVRTYHDADITFQGVSVVGNPDITASNSGGHFDIRTNSMIAFDFGNSSYENHNFRLINVKASGANAGILAPVKAGSEGTLLDGAILQNYVNIGFIAGADPTTFSMSNVTFLPSYVPRLSAAWPDAPADVWDSTNGILVPGTMSPDASVPRVAQFSFLRLLPDGRLKIRGGNIADSVAVSTNDNKVRVEVNANVAEFSRSDIVTIDFNGGNGDDVFTNLTEIPCNLVGGAGDDTLTGGAGYDQISGGDGNDFLNGNDGNDSIYGNAGNDSMYGGRGRDKIRGEDGDDLIDGGDDDDELLSGGRGDDTINGGDGIDILAGGSGDDLLAGGSSEDDLNGGEGKDILVGESGADVLRGDVGDDCLVGGGGSDRFRPGAGADQLAPEIVDLILESGANDQILRVDNARDELDAFGEVRLVELLKRRFSLSLAQATDRVLASIR